MAGRWPNDFILGVSAQLLPPPRHLEQLTQFVTKDMITAPCVVRIRHFPDFAHF